MSTESKPAVMETKKVAPTDAGRKPRQRAQRSGEKGKKLVCRYCGSDDLAPSFIKRRNARCRACFKKR
jgi:hypothetical protein